MPASSGGKKSARRVRYAALIHTYRTLGTFLAECTVVDEDGGKAAGHAARARRRRVNGDSRAVSATASTGQWPTGGSTTSKAPPKA